MDKFKIRQKKYFGFLKHIKQYGSFIKWNLKGKQNPPVDYIKQNTIIKYIKAHKVRTFVETGTYYGDTLDRVSKYVDKAYSVEIEKKFYENALIRFKKNKKIELLHGDSGRKISNILGKISDRTAFWLDGHYNNIKESEIGQITPIYLELDAIYSHNIKNHILLIDDSRLFIGSNGYPVLEDLKKYIYKKNSNARISIHNDIIIVEN